MAVSRYTKMAYDCADDMVFGFAKSPVSYGFGLKIGAGYVIPEINYAPRPGTEKDPEKLRKEYVDYITKDILDRAITVGFPLNMTYHSFWRDKEENYDVHPYCVKLFHQRWYMVAQRTYHDGEPRIYALDRIQELTVKDETFVMPKDWDAKEYFDGCFGIITDQQVEKQEVKIKVSASQANYIRSLKIHESQEEVECNEEYSIFSFFLRPQFDFQQELLKNGEGIEVLEPQWLRNEIGEKIKKMWDKYKRKK